jgi:hypothetical protein
VCEEVTEQWLQMHSNNLTDINGLQPVVRENTITGCVKLKPEIPKTKQTPWLLVRKRTIPTERPPLVDEI